jgi:regulator of sigma E protease
MITGKISVRESVSGPLQIFFMTAKVARLGLLALIHFIALLSISLAIFNLLPIPIFDGGHIFLLALEKIRNRKISLKTEQRINQVGLAIIIVLIVLVTFNDILKNYGDKFKAFIK